MSRRLFSLFILCALLLTFLREQRKPPGLSVTPDVSGQCFATARVNASAPCAACVHFVTIVKVADRWQDTGVLLRTFRLLGATLRASQGCFTLTAYTNARRGTVLWAGLERAGGANVTLLALPRDLPPNAYSGRDAWKELSRHKLDVVERYEHRFRRKAVWTDLDTVVVADLACAYARAPSFVVSILRGRETIRGPRGRNIALRPSRLVYGDLWMADEALRAQVRALERSGMPPPKLDVQDYFKVIMHPCDGAVIDLRALVRSDGFAAGDGMCFGWDYTAHGEGIPQPAVRDSMLRVVNGTLHCGLRLAGRLRFYPVASVSWDAPSFKEFLRNPRAYFNTSALQRWATKAGILVDGENK